jgi:hypothetical protein
MIETILANLKRVKSTSKNRWLACCPAHEDRSPSLSIMQNEQGKIFIHCFAGCNGKAIMSSIGMTLSDLYPERISPPHGLGKPLPFSPYDALNLIGREAMIVAMCGSELQSHPLSEKDRKRLFTAVGRINQTLKIAGVRHG